MVGKSQRFRLNLANANKSSVSYSPIKTNIQKGKKPKPPIKRTPGPYTAAKELRDLTKRQGLDILAEKMLAQEKRIIVKMTPEQEAIFRSMIRAGETPRNAMREIKKDLFVIKRGKQIRPGLYEIEEKSVGLVDKGKRAEAPNALVTEGTSIIAPNFHKGRLTPLVSGGMKVRSISPQKASRVLFELKSVEEQLAKEEQRVRNSGGYSENFNKWSNETRKKAFEDIQRRYKLRSEEFESLEKLKSYEEKHGLGKDSAGGHLPEGRAIMVKADEKISSEDFRRTAVHEQGHMMHNQREGLRTSPAQQEIFAEAFSALSEIKMGHKNPEFYKSYFEKSKSQSTGMYKEIDTVLSKIIDKYPTKEELLMHGPVVIRELTSRPMTLKEMVKKIEEM